MSQALHIFEKDLEHLKFEIALFIAVTLAYAWAEFHQMNQPATWALLAIAAVYLIARVIHAEAIPGDSQFWISRPYRWESLLGAKMLFILVVVNLPVFIARLTILLLGDFPLGAILPGLLWSHFLILLVFSLPVAAIAALTAGLVPFIFSVLLLLAAGLGIQALLDPLSLIRLETLANPIQWIWDALASVLLAAAAIIIVWIQYKSRTTRFSRTFAIAMAVVTTVAYLYLPWPAAFAVQRRVYGQALDSSSIHVASDQSLKRLIVVQSRPLDVQVGISIPLRGVPEGITAEANSLAVALRDAKGRTWRSNLYHPMGTMKSADSPGRANFSGYLSMPRAFLDEARKQPMLLSGSIYLTLFGNMKTKTVQLTDTPVDVMDGLQCGNRIRSAPFTDTYCRSLLRWPAKRVDVDFDYEKRRAFMARPISYSPFPADLSLENVVFGVITRIRGTREVTFHISEPLKSVRLDFEIPDVQVVSYAPPGIAE